MRFFPLPLEIGDEEGFTPEKDIFKREFFGKGLTNLISASDDPLVMVLDSPWGTGKTTFVKMWAGELRTKGFPVVYFDAFENDYVDNGFLAISGEVVRLSRSLKKANTALHKAFLKKAARAGGVLLRTGTKIGVKAATLGAIDAADIDSLKSVANDIAREASTKADEYVETLLNLQSQEQEVIASVRQALADLAESLSSTKSGADAEKRPLVFIIDELDRCRPDFALELIEKIKHIFSISNVHFVLVAHLQQLENSVRYNYGNEIDARTYLQKFYNLIVHFPERGEYRSERQIPTFIKYLAGKLSLNSDDLDLIQEVAEARDLSFRAIERIVSYVSLARSFTPENYLWLNPIITGLCAIKVVDPDLFRRAKANRISLDDIRSALATRGWKSDGHQKWMFEWWTFCLAEREEDHPDLDWKGFRQSLARYNVRDRNGIVSLMAGHIDRLQLPGR